jgi:hypothetical protein
MTTLQEKKEGISKHTNHSSKFSATELFNSLLVSRLSHEERYALQWPTTKTIRIQCQPVKTVRVLCFTSQSRLPSNLL